jgi:hypothetical protein
MIGGFSAWPPAETVAEAVRAKTTEKTNIGWVIEDLLKNQGKNDAFCGAWQALFIITSDLRLMKQLILLLIVVHLWPVEV